MVSVSVNNPLKNLIGKRMTKSVKFMGEDIKINKLSVSEVMSIQEKAKDLEADETKGLEVLRKVIRSAVDGADDISDEDFNAFPMDELARLSGEIMKFSGIADDKGK